MQPVPKVIWENFIQTLNLVRLHLCPFFYLLPIKCFISLIKYLISNLSEVAVIFIQSYFYLCNVNSFTRILVELLIKFYASLSDTPEMICDFWLSTHFCV